MITPTPWLPSSLIATSAAKTEDATFTDNSILYLPGMSRLESLVPDINYGDALAILNAMMDELEQDLPELKYYSLKETDLSGKAISLLLSAAFDRADEARNNFIQGMEKANSIGLTMGVFAGIFPETTGSFENGDFDHEIQVEAFSEDISEKATTLKVLVESGLPLDQALVLLNMEIEGRVAVEEVVEVVEEISDDGESDL